MDDHGVVRVAETNDHVVTIGVVMLECGLEFVHITMKS